MTSMTTKDTAIERDAGWLRQLANDEYMALGEERTARLERIADTLARQSDAALSDDRWRGETAALLTNLAMMLDEMKVERGPGWTSYNQDQRIELTRILRLLTAKDIKS